MNRTNFNRKSASDRGQINSQNESKDMTTLDQFAQKWDSMSTAQKLAHRRNLEQHTTMFIGESHQQFGRMEYMNETEHAQLLLDKVSEMGLGADEFLQATGAQNSPILVALVDVLKQLRLALVAMRDNAR